MSVRTVRVAALLIVLTGCTPDAQPRPHTGGVPVGDDAPSATIERLGDAPDAAFFLGAGRWLALGSSLTLHDVRQPAPADVPFGDLQPTAAAFIDGQLLLATADGLWASGDPPRESPLSDLVDEPVTRAVSDGRDLWLLADVPLHWRSGALAALDVDATVTDVIPAGDVTWLRHDDGLFAVDGRLAAVDAIDAPGLQSAAITAGGEVWLVEDGVTSVRVDGDAGDGTWLDVDVEADAVFAHPGSDRVWIIGDSRAWTGTVAGIAPVTLTGEPLAVDAHGRLLIRSGDTIERVSVEPTARVLDVPLLLTHAVDITVDAGRPDAVSAVTLRLEQSESPVAGPPFVGSLDPSGLPDETTEALLRVTVTWDDGSEVIVQQQVAIGDGVTWDDDIGPLAAATCVECHGESASTPLHTAEQWQARFADIQAQVGSGAMPFGREALPQSDQDLIQAWADAGFP